MYNKLKNVQRLQELLDLSSSPFSVFIFDLIVKKFWCFLRIFHLYDVGQLGNPGASGACCFSRTTWEEASRSLTWARNHRVGYARNPAHHHCTGSIFLRKNFKEERDKRCVYNKSMILISRYKLYFNLLSLWIWIFVKLFVPFVA